MKKGLLIAISILLLLVLIYLIFVYIGDYQIVKVKFDNGAQVNAYLANNLKKQKIGLSGFSRLDYNQGMLFVFPDSQMRSVWMKDMDFNIDVIWLDENKIVVDFTKDLPLDSYPETYSSQVPIKYFIEVRSGWIEKNNINLGQNVIFRTGSN
jgi:hypothetical protein